MFKCLINKIKKAFADPIKDPRCKGCVHVDGPICPYPKECSTMLDISNTSYNIASKEAEEYQWILSHKEDIEEQLDKGILITTYPHFDLRNKGWAFDIYYKYDGKWKDFSRNSIFSSSYLIQAYPTREEAWQKGMELVKEKSKN